MTAPAIDSAPDPLDYALAYAALGWRVVPIRPGTKRPVLDEWQNLATTDAARIRGWWGAGGKYVGWGIGLVCGPDSGVWVLDVDPRSGGDDTLAELERRHGPLPATVEAITGGGGRHLLFAWPTLPDGRTLGNKAGQCGPGLDVKADRGQILVAPTVHPDSGRRYEWELSSLPGSTPLAEAPAWLLDLATEPEKVVGEYDALGPQGSADERFAVDRYNADGDVNERAIAMLEAAGWKRLRTDRNGATYMERPGQTRHGQTGASVGKVAPGVVRVFTDGAAPLEPERGYRLFDLYALYEHGGDRVAAELGLVRGGWGEASSAEAINAVDPGWLERYVSEATPVVSQSSGEVIERGSTWRRNDVAGAVERLTTPGYEREAPTIGCFIGEDVGLYYAGRVNGLYGESGFGKSWLALHAVAEQLKAGRCAAWIDLEEPLDGVTQRLLDLHVPSHVLSSSLLHYSPDERLGPDAPILADLQDAQPSIVVIDSTGEALALEGAKPNDDDDVARWFATWTRRFARLSGAAVLNIDHVVKDKSTRGLWPGGSQRKRAAITGSAFMVDVLHAFGKGVEGRLKITCAKDRLGTYRQGDVVGTFVLDERGTLASSIERVHASDTAPTVDPVLMERVSIAVQNGHGGSSTALRKAVRASGWKGANELVDAAVDALDALGHLAVQRPITNGDPTICSHVSLYTSSTKDHEDD